MPAILKRIVFSASALLLTLPLAAAAQDSARSLLMNIPSQKSAKGAITGLPKIDDHATSISATVPYLRFASWYIEGLGDQKSLYQIGDVCTRFDLVVLTGADREDAGKGLAHIAEGLTSEAWDYLYVPPSAVLGPHGARGTLYLWRSARVNFDDWKATYPNDPSQFTTNPVAAHFTFTGHDFVVIAVDRVKSIYAPKPGDKTAADVMFDLMSWVHEFYPKDTYFLSGNFEADPVATSVFSKVSSFMRPVVVNTSTMVDGTKGGHVMLTPDDIWTNLLIKIRSGVYLYTKVLGISPKDADTTVSSHLPVFALVPMDW